MVCVAQAKPDWTLFTWRAPGVPSVPPRGSQVTARTFMLVLLLFRSVNLFLEGAVFSETVISMAGLVGKQFKMSSLLTD